MKFSTLLVMIVLAAVMASGCGCRPLEARNTDVDKEALPYYLEFKHTFKTNLNISVTITDDFIFSNEREIGRCHYGANSYIMLRKSWWAAHGDLDREQLVFHEMGHCLFGLEHTDYLVDYDFGGPAVPASIMNTSHIPVAVYTKYHDEYIKQLYETIYGSFTYGKR